MTDYQLAKQLKDAGFPQSADWFFNSETKNRDSWYDLAETTPDTDEYIACPSLKQLIKACGEDFGDLSQYKFPATDGQNWRAVCQYQPERMTKRMPEGTGITPEEAVAKLWLALHSLTQ